MAVFTVAALVPVAAQGLTTWQTGDVFAGVGNGQYKVYDNAGNLKETIDQIRPGTFTTGCSFNNSESHLYTTNFSTNEIIRFQAAPPLHTIDQTVPTPGTDLLSPDASNESISFMANGNYLVGHADGGADVHQYTEAGALVAEYDVATEVRGSDWIDIAANQTTLFYTSEGQRVLRFDIGTNTQMTDFNTAPLPGSNAFALRILPPGDGSGGVLVADSQTIVRLDAAGNVALQYDAAGEDSWFALNLDPNGTSFWSGDFASGNFYRFNIATGAIELGPISTGAPFDFFGLCLKGEPTAGGGDQCPPEEDDDGDGLDNEAESLFGNLVSDSDSDNDSILDGNEDANENGDDDEDEDDDDDDCPDEDEDGDGEDDEDEDDDEDDD